MDDAGPSKFWMTPEFPRRPGGGGLIADFAMAGLAGYKIEFLQDGEEMGGAESRPEQTTSRERRLPVIRFTVLSLKDAK